MKRVLQYCKTRQDTTVHLKLLGKKKGQIREPAEKVMIVWVKVKIILFI